jgi:FlaG/FlaF family flagellin (archaellin)
LTSPGPGVSEVVAALLLLSITVGVFGVFYTYYVSGLNSADTSVSEYQPIG